MSVVLSPFLLKTPKDKELARPVMGTILLVMIIISMNKSQESTVFGGRQKLTSAYETKARKVMVDFKFDALYR